MQSSGGENLTNGQTAESDYNSPGGNLTLAFCYPGSFMKVTVTDPAGRVFAKQGAPPLVSARSPTGRPGSTRQSRPPSTFRRPARRIRWHSRQTPPAPSGNIDTGAVVRQTFSNSQIANALAQAGSTAISLQVQGTSANSARIFYYSNLGGVPISWTIDLLRRDAEPRGWSSPR